MTAMPIHIGISVGQLTRFDDGLGEVSRQLCLRLAEQAPQLRAEHGIELWIHLRTTLAGSFGPAVHYLPITKWQRLSHRQPQRFAIWHTLNQLNKTLPPQGTGHLLVTVHDLNFFYFKNGFSAWRDLRRTRRLLARTDEVVTISNYVHQDVCQRMGWHGPMSVIHNGVRNLVDAPHEAVAALEGRDYLFHLSRLSPSKNVSAILALAAAWPEQHFVLAGPDGHDSRDVAARLTARPLANVTLLLSISDAQKAWLYASCRGFLFPSLTEGFGLPPLEAMYFGKSVFLSRLTSLPEVGGALAHYFDSFEPAAMRAVIETGWAKDAAPGRAEAVARHAGHFSWQRCADQYLALYLRRLGLRP